MPEPLSIVVGVGSLVNATTRISSCLQKLYQGLKNGPDLIIALSNEIVDLTLVLDQTQRANDNSGRLKSDDSAAFVDALQSQLDKAQDLISKLETLSKSLLKRKRSVQRVKWLLNDSKATALRDEVREVRRRIYEILTAHNTSISARIELQLHSVSSVLSGSRPLLLSEQSTAISQVSTQPTVLLQELQSLGRNAAQSQLEMTQQLSAIYQAISRLHPPPSIPVAHQGGSDLIQSVNTQLMSSTLSTNISTADRTETVYFSMGPASPGFPMSSHPPSTTKTRCDFPSCGRAGDHQHPTLRLLVTYAFPLWFVWRTLHIFLEASVTRGSLRFGLRFRRRADWMAAHENIFYAMTPISTDELKEFLAKQRPCATDISSLDGSSILHDVLALKINDNLKLQKLQILLQYGADADSEDDLGVSFRKLLALNRIWGWPLGMIQLEGLLSEQLFSEYLDELGLTYLHKTVAGIYPICVSSALQMIRADTWGDEVRFLRALNAQTRDGEAALHIAARRGDPRVVQMLLEAGADYNIKDKSGFTAPVVAAVQPGRGMEEGCAKCLELFLDAGADANETPALLQGAALGANLPAVQTLLDRPDVDLELRNPSYGMTAFHYAVAQSNIEIVRYLLRRGADINTVDTYGTSPLHRAVRQNFLNGLELLLEAKANHLGVSKLRGTILHCAALSAKAATMQLMARHDLTGLDPDIKNSDGYTAMQVFEKRPMVSDELREAFAALMAKVGVQYPRQEGVYST
ncbi:hypothetical protein B0H63DRAFT_550805 [Podospora didyma]|uniref:Fungal N-terminal domain-containing protein n=1 Tax=Podospora didyma TaxID=330526 RepID=A0AAE0N6B2_9PEZI|nr:hypothetical protein B0H63DRAFT_550805 [Podospora didyma]